MRSPPRGGFQALVLVSGAILFIVLTKSIFPEQHTAIGQRRMYTYQILRRFSSNPCRVAVTMSSALRPSAALNSPISFNSLLLKV